MTKRSASLCVVVLLSALQCLGASSLHRANARSVKPQHQFHFQPAQGRSKHFDNLKAQQNAQAGQAHSNTSVVKVQPQVTVTGTGKKAHKNLNPPVSQIGFVSAAQVAAGGAIPFGNPAIAGDFDGDGIMDVVTIVKTLSGGAGHYWLAVALGNGDGTFKTPVLTATPQDLNDPFVVGDLDGDGKDDVIIAHQPTSTGPTATFDVMLSNGSGGFTFKGNNAITTNDLAGGTLYDVNGDGKLDVVIVDSSLPGNVWTLMGNGDGTFQTATPVALSGQAGSSVVFGDFNGDGLLDFADNDYSTGQLTVYLAASATTYANGVSYTTASGVYDACSNTAGDLTGDGEAEIVSANCLDNTVTIYVNDGSGGFATGTDYAVATAPSVAGNVVYAAPWSVAVADLDGDGKADIISTNYFASDITVLHGNGDGTVGTPSYGFATGGFPSTQAIVADFNGDGLLDVLVADNVYSYSYMKGYGDGTFRSALDYYTPTTDNGEPYGQDIATGDFNGDGFPDVVIGNRCCDPTVGITVFLSRGDGSLMPGVNYGSGGSLAYVAVADVNKDGILDIAAVDNQNGLVQIFTGNGTGVGDGTFTVGPTYSTGDSDSEKIVAADLNGDGYPDLVVANNGNGNFGVFMNTADGSGSFNAEATTTMFAHANQITAADLNGDGKMDLVLPEYGCGCAAVFLGNGDGTFGAENRFDIGAAPYQIAVGDLDGDGTLDLAVTNQNPAGMGITVALGVGDGTFLAPNVTPYLTTLQTLITLSPYPSYLSLADLDGDGKLDLVYTNARFGTVGVMYNAGGGAFYDPVEYPVTGDSYGLVLADVNGDGAVDVVTVGTAGNSTSEATVLINSGGSGAAPNYNITVNPASVTVTAGQTGTYIVTLTPRNFYNGTVTFACSGLASKMSCAFSNPTLTPNGNTAMTTTLSLQTTAPITARLAPVHGSMLLASLSSIGIFGLILAGNWRRGRRMGIILGVFAIGMVLMMVACGGGNNSPPVTVTPIPGTPTGSYQIAVTATGTAGTNGGSTAAHTLIVTLVVQ